MGRVFGIDLGTTNSCIAYYSKGKKGGTASIVTLADGRNTLPSCVWYKNGKNGEVVVGREAYKQRWDKDHVVYSVKRLMGSDTTITLKDAEGNPFEVTPVEVSSEILKALKQAASRMYGEVRDVVITVPAYFNVSQRRDTKAAAELAGLHVLSLISEPTSAALAYGLEAEEGRDTILVYDLGGGTFDASLLRYEKIQDTSFDFLELDLDDEDQTVYQVLSTSGNNHLGGDDLDKGTADLVLESCKIDWLAKFGSDAVIEIPDDEYEKLILAVENGKKSGASARYFQDLRIKVNGQSETVPIAWDDTDMQRALLPIFKQTIACIQECLRSTKQTSLHRIVLVGGSTKYPPLKALLSKVYNTVEVLDTLNPDESVAMGAAIKAAADVQEGNISVDDILPSAVGVEVVNVVNEIQLPGRFSPILQKNSILPAEATKVFSTNTDDQETITVNVYQGTSDLVQENTYLGSLEFNDIPKGKAGEVGITVKFSVDVNGILTVTLITSEWRKEMTLRNILNPVTEHKDHPIDPLVKRMLARMQAMSESINDPDLQARVSDLTDSLYQSDAHIGEVQGLLGEVQKAYAPIQYAVRSEAFKNLGMGIAIQDSADDTIDDDDE